MESAVKTQTYRPGFSRLLLPRIRPGRALRNAWDIITHWETWDWRVKYIVISPAWLWCCIRARSLWFFTAANPTLTFGGFEGESKMEMYKHLPPGSYPTSTLIRRTMPFEQVEKLIRRLGYPVAVKPDVGKMGFMFRTIGTPGQLKSYHEKIPSDYIVQELITYPLEVSAFYYRFPGDQKGHITGFVRKEFLQVTGDGKSTLWELILNYPRVRFRLEEMRAKHRDQLDRVLSRGETYCLSQALNLSRGGKLVSLEHEKDERLLNFFDNLSHHAGHFYFGRYDVKCQSVESLKEGRDFSILEYNGSGAEPHHVYGNGFGFWQACSILVWHWNILCAISRENARRGFSYWSFFRGWKHLIQSALHFKKLKCADAEMAE